MLKMLELIFKHKREFDCTLYMILMTVMILFFGILGGDSQIELLLIGGFCSIGGYLYEQVLGDGLNLLFEKHGMPPIA